MKKFLVSLVLASSALVAAAPASAQYYGDRGHGDRYQGRYDDRGGERFQRNNWLGQRLDRIGYQISRGLQQGNITPREAQRLRAEHRNLWNVAQRYYASGGLDGRERNDLNRRLAWLQERVQSERRDDDRRGWRY